MKWLFQVFMALALWCTACSPSFASAVGGSASGVDDLTGKLMQNLMGPRTSPKLFSLTGNAEKLVSGLLLVQQSATLQKLFNNSTPHDQFGFEHKPEFAARAAFCHDHKLKELTNSQAVGELVALFFETKEELIRLLVQNGRDVGPNNPYASIAILLGDVAEKIVRGCWGIDEQTPAEQSLAKRILNGYKKSVEDRAAFGHPLPNTSKHPQFSSAKSQDHFSVLEEVHRSTSFPNDMDANRQTFFQQMGLMPVRSSSSASSSLSSSSVEDSQNQIVKHPNETLQKFLNGDSSNSSGVYSTLLDILGEAEKAKNEAKKKVETNTEEGLRNVVRGRIVDIQTQEQATDRQIQKTDTEIESLKADQNTLEARSRLSFVMGDAIYVPNTKAFQEKKVGYFDVEIIKNLYTKRLIGQVPYSPGSLGSLTDARADEILRMHSEIPLTDLQLSSQHLGYCSASAQAALVKFLSERYQQQLGEQERVLKTQQRQKETLQRQLEKAQQDLKSVSVNPGVQAKLTRKLEQLTQYYEAVKKAKIAAQNWFNGKPGKEQEARDSLRPYQHLF